MILFAKHEHSNTELELDTRTGTVRCRTDGATSTAILSDVGALLLAELLTRIGETVSYDHIADQVFRVHGRSPGTDPNGTVAIRKTKSTLNKQLSSLGLGNLVHTKSRSGYWIAAEWNVSVNPWRDPQDMIMEAHDATVSHVAALPLMIAGDGRMHLAASDTLIEHQSQRFGALAQQLKACRSHHHAPPLNYRRALNRFGAYMVFNRLEKADDEQIWRSGFYTEFQLSATVLSALVSTVP